MVRTGEGTGRVYFNTPARHAPRGREFAAAFNPGTRVPLPYGYPEQILLQRVPMLPPSGCGSP